MTIMRSGATKKYASNWSLVFGQKPQAKTETKAAKSRPTKKTPKKKLAPAKSSPAKTK